MGGFRARVVAVAVAVALSLSAGCVPASGPGASAGGTGDDATLTIAIAGMITPKAGLEYYMGLSEYIGRKVGRDVRLIHKADYSQVNDMLEARKVDVAFVCSGPYVAGHDKFGLELLVAPVANGAKSYRSYLIVPASSDATSLASLRGKTFAFTDPESNTGRLVPVYELMTQMGVSPEKYFAKTFFTYGHDNSIKAVATGLADGAAVDSLIYEYTVDTDPTYTSKTKVVEKSEPFAIPPVVVHPGMSAGLKARIRAAFEGASNDPEGRALLDKMQIERFEPIEDSAYDSIRRMNEWIAAHPGV